jgi:ABC-2 type transport system permease protein
MRATATAEAPAYEMKGPAALSGDLGRFFNLTRTLAVSDFKVRFFDSALGYLWTLMRPLLMFGVLYVVFSQVVRIGDDVRFYPAILLTGVVIYHYFADATGKSVNCVVDNENLVRKIHFPRMVIPLSVVLTASFTLLLNLVAVFFFLLVSGIEPRLSWLELPVLLFSLFVFVTGLGMLLSALYVPARDVSPIWEVVLQAGFYATPVFYPIEFLADESEPLSHVAMANPLAAIIQQFRHAVVDHNAPTAAEAIGGAGWLLVPAAIVVGIFALGFWVYNRMAPRIAEEL